MSNNTVNLNLYKANPGTDANNAFNMDTLFNNNWDKIDANCIKKDGSIPFVGEVGGVVPTQTSSLSTKGYVDNSILSTPQPFYIPYSVNSGAVDANGQANIISKIDNTSVKILATATPINLTYPDGTRETINLDQNITSLTNGTYTFIKEKGNNSVLATLSAVTESLTAPVSPVNGDYWLNRSIKPFAPYKRVAGAWVATQFVKLGKVIITAGVMATPTSFALNGVCELPDVATVASGSIISLNHNIGSRCNYSVKAVAQSNVNGYIAGDIADIDVSAFNNGNLSVGKFFGNETTIGYLSGSYTHIIDKTDSAAFNINGSANWKLRFIARREF